jgi:hypothetical protein
VLAAFDEGVARVSGLAADAAESERSWLERVRAVLLALLGFMDQQPCWGRFLILESPVATLAVAERRRDAVAKLARGLERETRRNADDPGQFVPSSRLTAEMVVGGVVSVLRAQLLEDTQKSLTSLAPALISFIARPYSRMDRSVTVCEHLPVRATYRTTRVLSAISAYPRSNNREIADAADVRDEGQTSKLLSRLEQRGLVQNVGLGAAYGEPNAWLLTVLGERVLKATGQLYSASAGTVGGAA